MKSTRTSRATALKALFKADDKVEFAYLFGSVAKRQTRPFSDLDIAVYLVDGLLPHEIRHNRLRILGDLMNTTGCNDIDLVVLNQSPVLLSYEILKTGFLLKGERSSTRVAFFSRTVKQFCDMARMRELHISASKQRIVSGAKRGSTRGFTESLERVRRLFV